MKQLYTPWGENLDVNNVLTEYPRPTLVRESFLNLNGYWDYAITNHNELSPSFDGKILVPFSPEAVLSGVSRQLMPDQTLFYQREVELDESFYDPDTQRLLLHFGAVDQIAQVLVNGSRVCQHIGGYLPFSVDISDAIVLGTNGVTVKVRDYTDTSHHSRGKQTLNRGGMWYTPQSGIWQTVWMESVPRNYIKEVRFTPDYDQGEISVLLSDNGTPTNEAILPKSSESHPPPLDPLGVSPMENIASITIMAADKVLIQQSFKVNSEYQIKLPKVISWSPENPFLYDVILEYGADRITSYFAMRKISVGKDGEGILRFMLNNQPYFHHGLLDQGYWPDGMYTPPSDEAMQYDILTMKKLGFNTLRKHIKIEPARWYYHCDKIGMLVWQDMVNGGSRYNSMFVTYFPTIITAAARRIKDNAYALFGRESLKGRKQFYQEVKDTITTLYNHPSIVLWVPFNEGWGQFDANKVTEYVRSLDSTRLVNQASGWFDQGGGDVFSIHNYFRKLKIKPDKGRVVAVTEYGGFALRVENHSFHHKVYGYRKYYSKKTLTKAFCGLLISDIIKNLNKGLSAAIYTQVSDIEEEVNGFLTYDRKILKFDEKKVKKWNQKLLAQANKIFRD